jgi:hypothetical protein
VIRWTMNRVAGWYMAAFEVSDAMIDLLDAYIAEQALEMFGIQLPKEDTE